MTKKIKIKEIESPQPHEISNAHNQSFVKEVESIFKQLIHESPAFRSRTKFLWFPKTIEGKTKWLTTASWQEQFVEVIDQEAMDLGSINCLVWKWKPVKWL